MPYLNSQTISSYKLNELKTQEFIDSVEQTVTELEASSDISEIYSLFLVLQAKVDAWPELFDQYRLTLIKMRFITLPLQIFDDILVLLQNNLLIAINYNINLYDKIILRFLLKDRSVFVEEQKKMLQALLKSNESVNIDNRVIYIRDLLKEYDAYIQKADDPTQFIEINKDVFINQEVRAILFYVLNLYEWLFFYETGRSSVPHKIQFRDKELESNKSTVDYKAIVDEIIKISNLNIADELLAQRAKNIILSCLRHIRDFVDTKATLCKPIDLGGMALDDATSDIVVNIIRQNIDKIEKPILQQYTAGYTPTTNHVSLIPPVPTVISTEEPVYNIEPKKDLVTEPAIDLSVSVPVPPAPPTLPPLIPTPPPSLPVKEPAIDLSVSVPVPPAPPTLPPLIPTPPPSLPVKEAIEAADTTADLGDKFVLGPKDDSLVVPIKTTISEQKITVDGVIDFDKKDDKDDKRYVESVFTDKPAPAPTPAPKVVSPPVKIINPITALGLINLVEFRKMDGIPKQRVDNIFSKIKLLGQGSFIKQFDSITAWQSSPLNQLYLTVAQKSILQAKPPLEIINNDNNPKENITIDEFTAILSLNMRLNTLI